MLIRGGAPPSEPLGPKCDNDSVTDDLAFDPDAFELRRNGQLVEIEPQALTVAAYLIEHRHRLVPKEELLDEIWGDRFVSESALTTRIKQIRRATGDSGSEQRVVKTIHGKGYRFIGEIVTTSARPGLPSGEPESAEAGPPVPAYRLPRPRTELVGRRAELDEITAAITRNRLTAMVGVGGVGKTSLAVAVGHAALDAFPDGVWFVDLIPISDADHVPLAIAKAAGLALGTGSALDQVARIIEQRQMLLVIDNCEHLLDAVANVVDQLLDETSAPRFLVTSREPLGLTDEARVLVDPLATDSDGPAVELLEMCAARYGVAELDRTRAADVCRELDGLPLAIELAAAQLRHLSLDDLAARLDHRFDLLVGQRPSRHAKLATVLNSTWTSIGPAERELLQQAAACPGALGLDDLIGLMGRPEHETLAALGRLVDCSLLVRSTRATGEYRMLETVRAYATEHDDQRPQRRDRLAAWCLDRVGADAGDHAFDFELAAWCRAHDDLLDAAEAHLTRRPDDAARVLAAQGLAMHLDDGGRAAELLTRIARSIDRLDDPGLRARVHVTGAFGAMAVRDPEALRRHGADAVREARLSGDPTLVGIALVLESWSAIRTDRALDLVGEAAVVAADAGDDRTVDLAEGYRAWHLAVMGRVPEAIATARAVRDRKGVVGYETFCASAALASCLALHDPTAAFEIYEPIVDLPGAASMMANEVLLATIHAAAGDVDATASVVTSVHRRVERAGQHALPDLLVPIAALAKASGDVDRARSYVGAVRRSARPTQSLQATCLYQQLRAQLDVVDPDDVGSDASSDAIGAAALGWLSSLVA